MVAELLSGPALPYLHLQGRSQTPRTRALTHYKEHFKVKMWTEGHTVGHTVALQLPQDRFYALCYFALLFYFVSVCFLFWGGGCKGIG